MEISLVRFSQSRMDMPAGENDCKDRTGDKVHPTWRWELPMAHVLVHFAPHERAYKAFSLCKGLTEQL